MAGTEYRLEIYEPGNSGDDVMQTFASDSPFLPIQAGEILNPRAWNNSGTPGTVLRVVNVEHIIWEFEEGVRHKVCIFTEEVEDNEAIRLTTP